MKRLVIFSLLIVIASSFVFAFQVGSPSHSIETSYSLENFLKGWINISFEDEPSDSEFETSEGDIINILDLIAISELKGEVAYECNPQDCSSAYSSIAESGENEKTITLADRESVVVGLRFSGGTQFGNVQDFSVSIESDAPEDTFKQLFIDVFDDGEIDWEANNPSGNFYNEDYGCFDFTGNESILRNPSVYCEKINIPIAPEVEMGANLIANTNPAQSATFTFTIKDEATGTKSASCDATTLIGGRIGCVPNFEIEKQEDYYICIKPKASNGVDNDKYKILSETTGDVCGYTTQKDFPKDYNLFAKPGKFEAVGSFIFDSDEADRNLEDEIENYVNQKYGGDCEDECIVPIKFTAGKISNQEIKISDFAITYTLSGGPNFPNSNLPIYEVEETPAIINSDFVQLHLDDVEFVLPSKIGQSQFTLKLGGNEVFSEVIEVEPVPQIVSLTPTIVAAALPTEFSVNVQLFGNGTRITKYEWSFDGELQETVTNSAIYAFDEIGPHTVDVTITDSSGKSSSKSFSVQAASPKDAVNMLLAKNVNNLNEIKTTLDSLELFDRNSLNTVLALDEAETTIGQLQQANATAISDDDYIAIMEDLVSITIPESLSATKNVNMLPFFPTEESVNLDVLKNVGGGEYTDAETYTRAVVAWNVANSRAKISSREFTAVYENHQEEILNVFEMQIGEGTAVDGAYLIMPEFENLVFDNDYSETANEGYVSIQLSGGENIFFSTTEDVEFTEIPAFISPPLNRLPVQAPTILDIDVISTLTIIILVTLFVSFVGFIAYIAMQQWYKKKYENYLFKNRNDLFNIVSYVHNMKKQGVEDNKVASGLKKSGWNSEQVGYIMNKYYGKRTGMFEIPIGELFKFAKHPKTFFGKTNEIQPQK